MMPTPSTDEELENINVLDILPKPGDGTSYSIQHLRAFRSQALASSDWTQSGDSPLSGEEQEAWAAYRQELRDLPSGDLILPDSDDWPTPPS